MQIKYRNLTPWMVLGLSIAMALWVVFEMTNRLRELSVEDQVLHFGEDSADPQLPQSLTLDSVINAHLFGLPPTEKKVVVPKVVNAPITELNLILSGLVIGPTLDSGYALIEVARGETSIVNIGQKIGKTGAVLHGIEADHILIERGGKIEKLEMDREVLGSANQESISMNTIKPLNLSEAELSALTEIGEAQTGEAQYSEVQQEFQSGEILESDDDFLDSDEDLEPGLDENLDQNSEVDDGQ